MQLRSEANSCWLPKKNTLHKFERANGDRGLWRALKELLVDDDDAHIQHSKRASNLSQHRDIAAHVSIRSILYHEAEGTM